MEATADALPIPDGPAEVTPEWLTRALRTARPDHPVVVAFERETVGPGVGFTGQVVRLRLECDGPDGSGLEHVIAKFPAPPGTARDLLTSFGSYEREVRFYTELAGEAGLPAPECYFAGHDSASGAFVLLLEDLEPAALGDQVAGCGVDEARQVVTEIARFHARWWNDEDLLAKRWLLPSSELAARLPELYEQGLDALRQEMRERFPYLMGLVERMAALVPELASSLGGQTPAKPFTLVHGDVRLDNLFFPSEAGGRFAVIDWQGVTLGPPANELAYWLILSLPVEVRRRHEAELLGHYYTVLREQGVGGYSMGRLRRDYGRGILVQLAGMPVLAASLDFSSERGQALATAAFERVTAAAIELKASRTIALLTWIARLRRAWMGVRRAFGRLGSGPRVQAGG